MATDTTDTAKSYVNLKTHSMHFNPSGHVTDNSYGLTLLAARIIKIFTSTTDSNELHWTLVVVALEKDTWFTSNSCLHLFIIFPLTLK